jgi:hypothetical protein
MCRRGEMCLKDTSPVMIFLGELYCNSDSMGRLTEVSLDSDDSRLSVRMTRLATFPPAGKRSGSLVTSGPLPRARRLPCGLLASG